MDFDRDGNVDVAVATGVRPSHGSDGTPPVLPPPEVALFLGRGDGSFSTPVLTPIGQASAPGFGDTAKGLAAGDFDGDGQLDVVVTVTSVPVGADRMHSELRFLRGQGTLGFAAPISSQLGDRIAYGPPVAGDFDQDGRLDVLQTESGTLLAVGDGNGRFAPPRAVCACAFGLVRDFSGDGLPDLATWLERPSIMLGLGDGTFRRTTRAPRPSAYSGPLTAADIDGNGSLDLVGDFGPNAAVAPGREGATFGEASSYALVSTPRDSATDIGAVDLNRDGASDVVAADAYTRRIAVLISAPVEWGACANPRSYIPSSFLVTQGSRFGDVIRGTAGGDRIDGRAGDDCLHGAGASVNVVRLDGSTEVVDVEGSDARSTRRGDVIVGGAGRDRIFGGDGNDKLYGGPGNDLLLGGPGADKLYGGPGNDRVDARDGVRDFVECGAGRDLARVDGLDRVHRCERVQRSR